MSHPQPHDSMTSKIPTKVKIGTSTWTVEFITRDLRDRDESGECDWAHTRLLIAEELGEHEREVTFLHELLHAACRFAGFDGRRLEEEEIVTRLTPVLLMILKDNGFWPKVKS